MFDTKLPVSYYKRIGVLNEEHGVYIVQHRENGKVFIEKVLRVYDPGVYEQLFRHPVRGIPRIYAMYEESGTLTVIEEYISGETLEEILSICGRLPEEDVIDCTVKLCDILSSLHSQDPMIIHRDIKPSNVILTHSASSYPTSTSRLLNRSEVSRIVDPLIAFVLPLFFAVLLTETVLPATTPFPFPDAPLPDSASAVFPQPVINIPAANITASTPP